MKVLFALMVSMLVIGCGGSSPPGTEDRVPTPSRLASPASGDTEIVLHVYQALYGKAPGHAQLTGFKAQIAANGAANWANATAANLNAINNKAFAAQLLQNISITPSNLTPTPLFGTSAQVYEALLNAVVDYLALVGAGNRGVVAAQLTKIISNLEVDTQFGVYGPAAIALNKQIALNLSYSMEPANLSEAVVTAPVKVTLMAINDLHGNLQPPSSSTVTVNDPSSPTGTRVSVGGLAYMATMVNSLRAQNPNPILVAAGDLVGTSPLTSSLFQDEPTIEALNLLGLEFSAAGTHEFDKGPAELKRLQSGGCLPRSADGTRGIVGFDTCITNGKFGGAQFQYLGANVIDQSTGKAFLPPYAIRRVEGIDIAFIGLTLKGTPSLTPPSGTSGLSFADEVDAANALIPELKAKGASSIVVLLSVGGRTTATVINDKTCPGLTGDVVTITDRLDPAVDVVISGNSHTEYVCTRPDGKLLTQALFHGRVLSKIDLVIDSTLKKVSSKQANNLPVVNDVGVKNAQGVLIPLPAGLVAFAKDSTMSALIDRFVNATAPVTNQVIGNLQTPLTRTTNTAGESQVGSLVADIYLSATSGAAYGANGAQIAFTNVGSVRADLNTSLQVTYGQLFSVMPFGNNLVTLQLTGAQIVRLLEQQWEAPQPAAGRIMQVSQGFSYTWDANQPAGAVAGAGARVVAGSVKLQGVPIVPTQTYRVTVNNFMASGGDNFTVLTQGNGLQAGPLDIDAGVVFFRTTGTIATPALNRITRLN